MPSLDPALPFPHGPQCRLVGPLPSMTPAPCQLGESSVLVEEPAKERGEALPSSFLTSQRVVDRLLHGDIPRRHTYAYTYVVFIGFPERVRMNPSSIVIGRAG